MNKIKLKGSRSSLRLKRDLQVYIKNKRETIKSNKSVIASIFYEIKTLHKRIESINLENKRDEAIILILTQNINGNRK